LSDVVVIAHTAERIPAALCTTVGTDRKPAVTALRHGRLARHTYVAITGYVFDLTELGHGYAALSRCANSAKSFADAFTSQFKFLKVGRSWIALLKESRLPLYQTT
jgi:hypothetical protein